MSRTWLAANGGNGLLESLLAAGEVCVDRVKVAPWMGNAALTVTAAAHPILLHLSDGVVWPRSGRWVDEQVHLTQWLPTPWVSAHLAMGIFRLGYAWPLFRLVRRPVALRWAVGTIKRWAASSPVRVLIENMNVAPFAGHAYLSDPAFISQVAEEADCGFLLDIAHARIAAMQRGESVQAYIQRLPLHRLVEIHVSGPRQRNGHLFDAHETLQEPDYQLLEWALTQARPLAVSLEYWQDRELLREQLARLRHILDTVQ